MPNKEDFEKAIEWAKSLHQKDPSNAQHLRRWGVMLFSLSEYYRVDESTKLLQDAIAKLKEALDLDSNDHEGLVWLGKIYKTKGLKSCDPDAAKVCFDEAEECFKKAFQLQPENKIYGLYLKDVPRDRKIHLLLNKGRSAAAAPGPSESSMPPSSPPPKKRKEKQ